VSVFLVVHGHALHGSTWYMWIVRLSGSCRDSILEIMSAFRENYVYILYTLGICHISMAHRELHVHVHV